MELTMPFDMAVRIAARPPAFRQTTKQVEIAYALARSVERVRELHHAIWRDVGWLEDGDEAYEELEVCGACVPKHSHFPSRADVPLYPCPTIQALQGNPDPPPNV